jgi:hypothetical protein
VSQYPDERKKLIAKGLKFKLPMVCNGSTFCGDYEDFLFYKDLDQEISEKILIFKIFLILILPLI